MELLRYIGGKVSKQAFRMNIGTSVRHHQELDVDTTAFCFGVDFGDKEALHLSRLLAGNNTLRTIRLRIQPKLTVRGAEALARAIVRSSITKLHVFGTVRTVAGQQVAAALGQHSREHFGPNRFSDGHPIWEFANPQVIRALLLGISQSVTIQELIISYYVSYPPGYLSTSNMQDIALLLSHNRSIKSLNLGFNLMSDDDVTTFVQLWRHDSSLREIHLKLNRIGAAGAVQLLQVLAASPCMMQKMDLSFNFGIGYHGLQRIGEEVLPQLRLKELKLCGCVHLWDNVHIIAEGEVASIPSNEQADIIMARDKAARALINGIRENVYLQTLDVRNNHLSEHVLEEIGFYCELNKSGRYLLAMEEENTGVAPGVWCHVLAKCRDDVNFLYYFLREQPNLVRPPLRSALAPLSPNSSHVTTRRASEATPVSSGSRTTRAISFKLANLRPSLRRRKSLT